MRIESHMCKAHVGHSVFPVPSLPGPPAAEPFLKIPRETKSHDQRLVATYCDFIPRNAMLVTIALLSPPQDSLIGEIRRTELSRK